MKVLTGGTFDILHYGHVLHLNLCARLAGGKSNVSVMIVGNTWARQRKREPILDEWERFEMVKALGFNNIIFVNSPDDLLKVTKEFNPDIYVYEYGTNSTAHDPVIKYCTERGIGLLNIGKNPINPFGTSTTSIVGKIYDLCNNSNDKTRQTKYN